MRHQISSSRSCVSASCRGWYVGSSALLALASHLKLKLKLQYFSRLMRTATSSEKALMLGQIGQGEQAVSEDDMVGWHQ